MKVRTPKEDEIVNYDKNNKVINSKEERTMYDVAREEREKAKEQNSKEESHINDDLSCDKHKGNWHLYCLNCYRNYSNWISKLDFQTK